LCSCGDNSPYKRFSLKHLGDENDSTKKYKDRVSAFRLSINADFKEKAFGKLFEEKSKWNRFNGSVLIAQEGTILFKKSYGFANYKQKINLTDTTSFELASTTKTFTATAIMLLKQQDKLNYSDDVKKHIPDFPYEGITIQMLLTHRSGLPNYMYFSYVYIDKYPGIFNNEQLLKMLINEKPAPYFKANKRFSYCNTNYALLASIIEKVSGQSYAAFMYENIFLPLKMNNTWVNTPENATQYLNKTTAYSGNWRVEDPDFLDGVYGDKGIYSNVEDMFKWDQSFYTCSILKKETIEDAFTGKSKEKKGANNYGYGFRIIDDKKGGKTIYHNGWWHCYNTTFYRRLNDKCTIIILSNKYNKSVYQIADILSILNIPSENPHIELE